MKVMAGRCSRAPEVGALSEVQGFVADQLLRESSHDDIAGSESRRFSLTGVERPEL